MALVYNVFTYQLRSVYVPEPLNDQTPQTSSRRSIQVSKIPTLEFIQPVNRHESRGVVN
jgi:hypothetical protein